MNHSGWRKTLYTIQILAACALLAGCAAFPELSKKSDAADARQMEEARRAAELAAIHEHIRQLQEQIDLLKQTAEGLGHEVEQLQRRLRDQGHIAAQIDDLQKKIQELGKAREQDRVTIVDDISRKLSSLLETQRSAAQAEKNRAAVAEAGYEHVVQRGQTLSEIAKAYGVSQSAVLNANRIKHANSIYVGQKLFIPEK